MADMASSFFICKEERLKTFLVWFLTYEVVVGVSMYAYLLLQWHTEKRLIEAHGWDMEFANPSEISDIWRWFVPIYRMIMFPVAGTIVEELAFREKRECNGKIVVKIFGFEFTYQQPIA